MSNLLDGSQKESSQQQQLKGPEAYLSSDERKQVQRWLGFPEDFPKRFKEWLPDWIAVNGLEIPITQVRGLTNWLNGVKADIANVTPTVTQATVAPGLQSTSSASYTDLTTSGPTLTGLKNGSYIIHFGTFCDFAGSTRGAMSVSVNGGAASDGDACSAGTDGAAGDQMRTSISRAVAKTLSSGDNNSITMKYRKIAGPNGDPFFDNRWVIAMRTGP